LFAPELDVELADVVELEVRELPIIELEVELADVVELEVRELPIIVLDVDEL